MGYSTLYCPCCKEHKGYNSFFKSPLLDDDKYVVFCKPCLNKKLDRYKKKIKNDKLAVWSVLAECKVPFIKTVYEQSEALQTVGSKYKKPEFLTTYFRCMYECGESYHGFWESDVMADELMDKKRTEENKNVFNGDEEIQKWGKIVDEKGKLDIEAYNYLNLHFNQYTQELPNMDVNLENRYRDLVRCELRLRRANEKGDGNEISKAQDSLNKQLALLRLNDFQSNHITDEKRAFEHNVSLIENYRPAECEELKEYLDKVGYEKEKAILMRSIRNAIAETREYPNIPKEYQ